MSPRSNGVPSTSATSAAVQTSQQATSARAGTPTPARLPPTTARHARSTSFDSYSGWNGKTMATERTQKRLSMIKRVPVPLYEAEVELVDDPTWDGRVKSTTNSVFAIAPARVPRPVGPPPPSRTSPSTTIAVVESALTPASIENVYSVATSSAHLKTWMESMEEVEKERERNREAAASRAGSVATGSCSNETADGRSILSFTSSHAAPTSTNPSSPALSSSHSHAQHSYFPPRPSIVIPPYSHSRSRSVGGPFVPILRRRPNQPVTTSRGAPPTQESAQDAGLADVWSNVNGGEKLSLGVLGGRPRTPSATAPRPRPMSELIQSRPSLVYEAPKVNTLFEVASASEGSVEEDDDVFDVRSTATTATSDEDESEDFYDAPSRRGSEDQTHCAELQSGPRHSDLAAAQASPADVLSRFSWHTIRASATPTQSSTLTFLTPSTNIVSPSPIATQVCTFSDPSDSSPFIPAPSSCATPFTFRSESPLSELNLLSVDNKRRTSLTPPPPKPPKSPRRALATMS